MTNDPAHVAKGARRLRNKSVLSAGLLAVLAACSVDDSSEPGADDIEFDVTAMLANAVDGVMIPNYEALAEATGSLAAGEGPLAGYCDAIGTGNEAAARAAAQQSWRDTMDAAQRAELHIVGPAAENSNTLRNRIISFGSSSLSTCGVDQSVVLADEDASFDVSNRSLNQRGLGAIEYLLFNDDLDHTCPSQIPETADWNARPEAEREQLRCDYAEQLAADTDEAAGAILDAWQPEGGNYRAEFLDPSRAEQSFKALSDALFYLDTHTKDLKLGVPLGLNDDCSALSCPDAVESPYAEDSLMSVATNLEAFVEVMNGGSGLGFDDIMISEGFDTTADSFVEQTQAALTLISGTNESVRDQAGRIDSTQAETECINAFASPDSPSDFPACNLHGLIKRITDDLKSEFVAIVNVDIPTRAQGDND